MIAVLLALPATAFACGSCVFSIFEYALPHTLAWCLGVTIWFWIVMTISAFYRFFTAVLWIIAAFFIGATSFGPLPFVLLGLMALTITVKMFRWETWKQLSKKKKIRLKTVSATAALCMATGLTISMQSKAIRSDANFILQEGGHQGRVILRQLIAQPQKNSEQLKYILANRDESNLEHVYFAEEISQALTKTKQEKHHREINL